MDIIRSKNGSRDRNVWGAKTTKPSATNTGLVINDEEFRMATHLPSSWEIMPQAITVCTGDVHIDGTIVAVLVLAWLIRMK